MSLKTRVVATTVALVVAGAFGYQYLGRGGELDHSSDRDVHLSLAAKLERPNRGLVFVYLNDLNRTEDEFRDAWSDHFWVRPGEKVRLTAHIVGKGSLKCTIDDGEKPVTKTSYTSHHWEEHTCEIIYVGH